MKKYQENKLETAPQNNRQVRSSHLQKQKQKQRQKQIDNQRNQRPWLKQSLVTIQDNIAEQVSKIIQLDKQKQQKKRKQRWRSTNHGHQIQQSHNRMMKNKYTVLHSLQRQEEGIRKKLREIALLKKNHLLYEEPRDFDCTNSVQYNSNSNFNYIITSPDALSCQYQNQNPNNLYENQFQRYMYSKTQSKTLSRLKLNYTRKLRQGQIKTKTNKQLKQLTLKYRQFKSQIQQKTRLINQKQQEQKIKIIKLKQQHLRTQCAQRRKRIQEKLARMQQRKIQREEQLKKQKDKLKDMKKLKKNKQERLYDRILKNYNKRINQINQEKIRRYREFRKENSVDLLALGEHQKKYNLLLADKEERRTLRLEQSRILPEINGNSNIYKSKFMDRVLEQQHKRHQAQKNKKQRGKILIQKHKQFQQKVKEQYSPHIRQHHSQSQQKQKQKQKQNKIKKTHALQWQQIKKKGNQYYKLGQKCIMSVDKRQEYEKSRNLQKIIDSGGKKYPNYLGQAIKKSKLYATVNVNSNSNNNSKPNSNAITVNITTPGLPSSSPPSQPKTKQELDNKAFESELKTIKQIIKNPKIDKLTKIEQIKWFIQKMTYTFTPNREFTQDQLISRLNVKMELLEYLNKSNNQGEDGGGEGEGNKDGLKNRNQRGDKVYSGVRKNKKKDKEKIQDKQNIYRNA